MVPLGAVTNANRTSRQDNGNVNSRSRVSLDRLSRCQSWHEQSFNVALTQCQFKTALNKGTVSNPRTDHSKTLRNLPLSSVAAREDCVL